MVFEYNTLKSLCDTLSCHNIDCASVTEQGIYWCLSITL
mgnify:CR=1 FL=1